MSAKSVFINCPFDAAFAPQFRALLFTLIHLGYEPRCALESANSDSRFDKILQLIGDCPLSIHDLSMQGLDAATGLPRLNMSFELGLTLGCRHFGEVAQHRSKSLLVLDSDPRRYRASLSDFAGHDIQSHGGQPDETIRLVRNWLATQVRETLYGPLAIQREFGQFEAELPALAAEFAKTTEEIPYTDLYGLMRTWLSRTGLARDLNT